MSGTGEPGPPVTGTDVDALAGLGTSRGLPEAVQALADHAPELSSGNVLYSYGIAVSLAVDAMACPTDDADGRPGS